MPCPTGDTLNSKGQLLPMGMWLLATSFLSFTAVTYVHLLDLIENKQMDAQGLGGGVTNVS